MTDKTTPSTESDTADATRKRATGASRRSAAPRRAPARKGGADAAAPAARPRAAADEPPPSCAAASPSARTPPARRRPPCWPTSPAATRPPAPARQEALRAVIEELSPDDARAVHRALLEVNVQGPVGRRNPDDELAVDWREGIYPYRHRMLRRNYEKQKYALQVELLKLQAWVKATGQRVVILFEGATRPARAGPSSA